MSNDTKLTIELSGLICGMIEAGNNLERSAIACGISKNTLDRWIKLGEKTGAANKDFRDFAEAVERARATSEHYHIAQISRASSRSWQAAAWLLERQYPERWGKVSERKQSSEEPAETKSTFFDELKPLRDRKAA